jgi:hypothetical protein
MMTILLNFRLKNNVISRNRVCAVKAQADKQRVFILELEQRAIEIRQPCIFGRGIVKGLKKIGLKQIFATYF